MVNRTLRVFITLLAVSGILLSACSGQPGQLPADGAQVEAGAGEAQAATPTPEPPLPTAFPERPRYAPGELVDYTAQTGDTLAALAVRFNTTIEEIMEANSFIPVDATTMPPGMPMKIPIYYLPLWGTPEQILPDSLFINGPAQVGFDIQAFVDAQPGWLKTFHTFLSGQNMNGAGVVKYIAEKHSVSPRLLLALLEFHSGALSQPTLDPELADYPLGYRSVSQPGLYLQLNWTANILNNGYYRYRLGTLTDLYFEDGRQQRFDPWQNAATASLHNYFNTLFDYEDYLRAASNDGFVSTYRAWFGDPWLADQPHIPGSLVQPEFRLPFSQGDVWAFTGGPHGAWGTGEPLAAIDFAPPSVAAGCLDSGVWTTAMAPGVIVRSSDGELMIDTDGDGDERTGWNIYYLHLATYGRPVVGAQVQAGDPIGHPSCEGGRSTGTHVHIARKYNGEWIPAEGLLTFNLDGWKVEPGSTEYKGKLIRNNQSVISNTNANGASFIRSDR